MKFVTVLDLDGEYHLCHQRSKKATIEETLVTIKKLISEDGDFDVRITKYEKGTSRHSFWLRHIYNDKSKKKGNDKK